MQTYLFAANLFTLTAFFLGLNNFSKGSQSWRLLPLFLLVISQSLSLIISLIGEAAATAASMAALSVFSAVCLVWALINLAHLPLLWRRLALLGGGTGLLLTLFPLIPDWPMPYQIHTLIITMLGTFLILGSLDRVSWSHLAAPLFLAVANFLSLLGLIQVSWLAVLCAYGFLIGALHWESVQTYQGRQQLSQAMARQAVNLSQERQRLLEVSEIISAVPSLEQSMTHLARSMAHITHSDQAAIFTLDVELESQIRLVTIYSPERPVLLTGFDEISFDLGDCPPLQIALVGQNQRFFTPEQNRSYLESLYTLWNENRIGPTLLQPLLVQGRSIGVLMLGNPVTHQPVGEADRTLCRSLAAQIATMVEAYRRYIDLELRATPPEKFQTKPLNEPALAIEPAAAPEAEADLEPQLTPDLKPNLVLPAAKPIIYKPNLPAVSQVKLAEAAPAAPTIPLPSRVAGQSTIDLRSQPAQLVKKSVDYLSILDTVEEGVVVSNALGRVQLVNRAAEHILGRSRRELLEQSIGTIYGQIASEEKIEILMTSFSRRNEPLPTFVERDDRAIQGRLIPWRDDEQEWLGIVAVFKDVTPSVKAERIQNNFIMALSRVLRGPLTLIKGYAELTTTGLFEEYSPEQLQVQRIIHSSVERVVEILDNAIQISTQQRNKLLPKFENVNLIKVIDEVWREITPLAKLRQIKLVREISTAPLSVTADWLQLYRILENLLSNACRFTPPGGQVTLRAWVQHEREGNISQPRLILTVADNGVGIPRTEFKRIFDPFYQLDNQPPTDERGMGLGLAVVKELVEMHRGKVWVESKVGEGSIFQVSLPLTQS